MLAAIFRIVALVRKELLAMLKDPRGRAVLFVPPVLQCIVFGYVVNYDLTRVAYIAFDRDRSAASSELLASLDGSGVFQRVANLERAADVKTMIDERRALVAVRDRSGFRAPLTLRAIGRCTGDRRRSQFEHRRHGAQLCPHRSRFVQC